MNIVWSYVATGLLTVSAAAAVAGGEPATAELRLVEAATMAAAAGISAVCFLAAPQAVTSVGKTPAID
ncbi:hypothetical protein QTH90_20505 [Variovorax sp. J2P1-59]|uniref:hypothetical protein n=1 Tax=Variovorax flavidus TaxID=3053501 RepID=UPI002579096A|nr:hypothetical protein [Variovorax sp. J2P1-59]MDM0076802.1 hypothetical protein [Variovorax sp. J2P1-59]